MGYFLGFLYTGDYFPKKVPGQRTLLEKDPSIPDVDMTGEQLLRHAKVYTLAEKFGLTTLKNLASSKILCVNSNAKGEIAYARYVYAYTKSNDTSIRVPVANFWATRSHTLRSEADEEFCALCLEYPQFGYDMLSLSSCPPTLTCALLTHCVYSPRPRRESRARAQRKDAPRCAGQRAQAPPPQQHGRLEREKGGGISWFDTATDHVGGPIAEYDGSRGLKRHSVAHSLPVPFIFFSRCFAFGQFGSRFCS